MYCYKILFPNRFHMLRGNHECSKFSCFGLHPSLVLLLFALGKAGTLPGLEPRCARAGIAHEFVTGIFFFSFIETSPCGSATEVNRSWPPNKIIVAPLTLLHPPTISTVQILREHFFVAPSFFFSSFFFIFLMFLSSPLYFFSHTHTQGSINRIYGFFDECKRNYNVKLWRAFCDVFEWMPVAGIGKGSFSFCSCVLCLPLFSLYSFCLHPSAQRCLTTFSFSTSFLLSVCTFIDSRMLQYQNEFFVRMVASPHIWSMYVFFFYSFSHLFQVHCYFSFFVRDELIEK